MPDGLIKELREVEPVALPERDVRAGRPVLNSVLRFDTVRAVARIATLGALDLSGLFLAIYTALLVKAAISSPDQVGQMWAQAKEYFPLGGLVMLLLFARSGLYRERAQRPGFREGDRLAVPGDARRPRLRASSRARTSSRTTSSTARCSSR